MNNIYTLEFLGKGLISTVLGGEGVGMAFEGPCTVYTQSHNINDLLTTVAEFVERRGGNNR